MQTYHGSHTTITTITTKSILQVVIVVIVLDVVLARVARFPASTQQRSGLTPGFASDATERADGSHEGHDDTMNTKGNSQESARGGWQVS